MPNIADRQVFIAFVAVVNDADGPIWNASGTKTAGLQPLLQVSTIRKYRRRGEADYGQFVFDFDTTTGTESSYSTPPIVQWSSVTFDGWGLAKNGNFASAPTSKPEPADSMTLRTTTIGAEWPWGNHAGMLYYNSELTTGAKSPPFVNAGNWPTTHWAEGELLATAYQTQERYLGFRARRLTANNSKMNIAVYERRPGQHEIGRIDIDTRKDEEVDMNPIARIPVTDKHITIDLLGTAGPDTGIVLLNYKFIMAQDAAIARALIATPKLPFWLRS